MTENRRENCRHIRPVFYLILYFPAGCRYTAHELWKEPAGYSVCVFVCVSEKDPDRKTVIGQGVDEPASHSQQAKT